MDINNKIYELRKKHNYSQEQLAEKLNVTRQTITKWELNETTPDFLTDIIPLLVTDLKCLCLLNLVLKYCSMLRIFLIY